MSAANLLPLSEIAAQLKKPLQRVEEQESYKRRAQAAAEMVGGGIEETVTNAVDLMRYSGREEIRANMTKFMLEKVWGIGKEEASQGPSIVINIKGDDTKIASVLNPTRE